MIKIILLTLMLLIPHRNSYASSKTSYSPVLATVVKVHDGDTIKVTISGWPPLIGREIGVRVYGVDTRELKTGAHTARDAVRKWIQVGDSIWLVAPRRDKYFRILADIGFDCGNLEQITTCDLLSARLISEKLAVPYFGGTKVEFTDDIK